MNMIRILRCNKMTLDLKEEDIFNECGSAYKEEKEIAIYEALREALLDYPKLLATFGKK